MSISHYIYFISRWATIIICMFSLTGFAQDDMPLVFNQTLSATLTPQESLAIYTFSTASADPVSITLTFPAEDIPVRLSLLDASQSELAANELLNYPAFTGAYIIHQLPAGGTYQVRVEALSFDGVGLQEPVGYTLTLKREPLDEFIVPIQVGQRVSGVIHSPTDQDFYTFIVEEPTPLFITVSTPQNILDPEIGILDANLVPVVQREDFYTTAPMLLFFPPAPGEYALYIVGQFEDSEGPYSLIMRPINPLGNPPDTVNGAIDFPGDARAYSVTLTQQQVYDFQMQGQGIQPVLVLTDPFLNPIAWDEAETDARIPGYAPLQNETLFLIALAYDESRTGAYTLSTAFHQDEEDDRSLAVGGILDTVIAPFGDVDRVTITVEADKYYSLIFYNALFNLDPALRILDSSGNEVFFVDDSVRSYDAHLSRIQFPEAGVYTVELMSTPLSSAEQPFLGVGRFRFAEGAPFDLSAPILIPQRVEVVYLQDQNLFDVVIPSNAIGDDTYPISGTATVERTGEQIHFVLERNDLAIVDIEAQEDDIFFLTLQDSADSENVLTSIAFPGPEAVQNLLGMPFRIAINESNEIFLTDSVIGGIYKVQTNGQLTTYLSGETTLGGLFGPNALAFDHQGVLYMSNGATNEVIRISPSGATETVAANLGYPVDIAFDQHGTLYVAQIGNDQIDKVHPDGTVEPFVTTIRNPYGLAFGPDGNLYVCNSDRGRSSVFRVLPDGTVETFASEFAETLEGIAVDAEGYIYTSEGPSGLLYRISPQGEIIPFSYNLTQPAGLAFGRGDRSKFIYSTQYKISDNSTFQYELIAIPTGRQGFRLPVTGIEKWWRW
ncbi:MAG: NHL repeat-containing protein [bacterium]